MLLAKLALNRLWSSAACLLASWLLLSHAAQAALTPTSPEVRQAIDRGVEFLLTAQDERLGARALVGRVLIAQKRRDHPRVQGAVEAIRAQVKTGNPPDLYSLGLCILFLNELDAEQYRDELRELLAMLQKVQKQHGGWGYPERTTGDTSMTQYAVLSAWVATESGYTSPRGFWLTAIRWLLRTQDPSGGFGYQGVLAPDEKLVPQSDVSVTLSYAGLQSLYLCADRLGLITLSAGDSSKVPDVFRRVTKPQPGANDNPGGALGSDSQLTEQFRAAVARAIVWRKDHEKVLSTRYVGYFFYTLERMETIREAVSGQVEAQPAWYHDAATYLVKNQLNDGSWLSQEGQVPCTAFAILTLGRSTREVIEKARGYGAGTMISGRGLPSGDTGVAVRFGQLVPKPLTGPAESLLEKLENSDAAEYDRAVEALDDLAREADAARLTPLAARLRKLAAGAPPEAKAAAIRALARARNFDDAPLLIAALNDPHPAVFRAAHEGLVLLTRRTGLAPLPQEPSAEDRGVIQKRWRDWLKTVQPEAVLE